MLAVCFKLSVIKKHPQMSVCLFVCFCDIINNANAIWWSYLHCIQWTEKTWRCMAAQIQQRLPWQRTTRLTAPETNQSHQRKRNILYLLVHESRHVTTCIEQVLVCDSHFIHNSTPVHSSVLRLHVVRLSVTLVDQDHIGWKSWKLMARTLSPTPSLFVAQRPSTFSQGNMRKFGGD